MTYDCYLLHFARLQFPFSVLCVLGRLHWEIWHAAWVASSWTLDECRANVLLSLNLRPLSRFSRDARHKTSGSLGAHSLVQPGRSTQHCSFQSVVRGGRRFHHTLSANTARKQEKDLAEIALITTSRQFCSNFSSCVPHKLPETSLTRHLRAFWPVLLLQKAEL